MKKIIPTCFIIILFFSNIYSQTFQGYPDHMFLMQQPNARSEAMGRGQAAMYGSPFQAFYNPASTSFNKELSVEFTYMQPHFPTYPFLEGVNFKHYGISCSLGKYGAISINNLLLDNYENVVFIDDSPTGSQAGVDAKTYLTMLNYSYALNNNLSIGVNLSYFKDEFWGDNLSCTLFDLGILKRFPITSEKADQEICAGISCSNILNAKVEQGYFKEYLPSILRLGASYEMKLNEYTGRLRLLNVLLAAEYRYLLNSNFYTAGQFGSEFTFIDLIIVRAGYYIEDRNGVGDFSYKNTVKEFTYGAGLDIDLEKLFSLKMPIGIKLDFARLPVPEYRIDNSSPAAMYSIYSINCGIKI